MAGVDWANYVPFQERWVIKFQMRFSVNSVAHVVLSFVIILLALIILCLINKRQTTSVKKSWENDSVKLIDELNLDQLHSLYKRASFDLWKFTNLFCPPDKDSVISLKLVTNNSFEKAKFEQRMCMLHKVSQEECQIYQDALQQRLKNIEFRINKYFVIVYPYLVRKEMKKGEVDKSMVKQTLYEQYKDYTFDEKLEAIIAKQKLISKNLDTSG
jgi:hypothetical protein